MTAEELTSGKQLGRFTLDRRLALGGMAEIWLANERLEEGSRPIALKILLAPFAKDPVFRGMFADEVNIASRLTHENIVQIFGAFELDGHLLQAMEIVEGRDLRRMLSSLARSGDGFPVPLALLVGREVARALGYAHAKRGEDGRPLEIVHRDISPHNIMITRTGGVKVLDFGIASAAERLTRTRTGVIKGKIAYMAPEQALALGVTSKTDIFALGIVLWEMLAMQRLFKADSDALVLERVVKAEVPPIREFNPAVPDEAAGLLSHMLQQRAQNRPESMRSVENTLTRILMRHFREEQTTPHALAAWASSWLDLEPKKTGRFLAPDLPPMQAEHADPPTKSDLSDPSAMDQTLAMKTADPLGASGGHSVPERDAAEGEHTLPELELPPEVAMDPTLPVSAPPDKAPDRVRLPSRSEIRRAVDAVPTTPLLVDPTVLQAPVGLPKVSDPETERDLDKENVRVVRIQGEGRVASGTVVAGEATIPPARVAKKSSRPLPLPPEDEPPTKPSSDPTWLEVSDEHGFAPVKVGFSDAIHALDRTKPPEGPQPPVAPDRSAPPPAHVPRWVYPTLALLFSLIVILLILLVMKG